MIIKRSLVLSRNEKTDDELRAVMTTHPWAPRNYGFYKSFGGTWAEYADRGACDANWVDAIWVDLGVGYGNWIVEGFHTPHLVLDRENDDPFDRANKQYRRHKRQLENRFWKATVELIVYQISYKYQTYAICYGEIRDELSNPNPEAAWRDGLLDYLDYGSEVKAALGVGEAV